MSKNRKWKEGVSSDVLKERNNKKGQFYRAPGDRVSYFSRTTIKAYVPKEGKNRIRIVQPLEVGELLFYGLEMHFHRSVGDEGEEGYGDYLCNKIMKAFLRKMYDDIVVPANCFVCEQQTTELWDTDPQLAKTYYPDRRMWFFVHDLLSDDPEEVLLWSCPWTLQEEIVSRSTDEETQRFVDVSHPVDGVPVSFERQGMGKLTKYVNVQIFKSPMPLTSAALDQLIEFREAIIIPEYEEVKKAFLGQEYTNPVVNNGLRKIDTDPEDQAAQPDGPPECFKKEYDKWQDCESCDYSQECSAPELEEKPKRPEKPQRPQRSQNSDEDVSSSKKSIKDRIKSAQAQRQAK